MVKLRIEDTDVTLYTDHNEFAKEFYDVPEGAILDTENLPESTGFATISHPVEIFIYKRKDCSFIDLLSTVSHELGHIVEGGFKKNPPDKLRYFKKHEQKAEHYEAFAMKAYKITDYLFNFEKEIESEDKNISSFDYIRDLEFRCKEANFAPYDDRLSDGEFVWDKSTVEIAENWLKEHHTK